MQDRKHSHYFRNVSHLQVMDLYRFLEVFNVTDPCFQHAIKKLVVPGMRGGGKSTEKDLQEAIDTLMRRQEMNREELVRAAAGGAAEEQSEHWSTHADGEFIALYGKLALLYKKQGLPAIQSDSQIDAALMIVDELEKLIQPCDWKPIAQAPRDGTMVLLRFGEDGVSQGKYLTTPALNGATRPWLIVDENHGEWFINRMVDGPGGPSHYADIPVYTKGEYSPARAALGFPHGEGEVLGRGYADFPDDLASFAERKAYQRGVGDARRLDDVATYKGQAEAWMKVYNKLLEVQGELSLDDGDSGTAIGAALTLIDNLVAQYKQARTSLRELCPQLEALQIALKGAAEDRCIVVPWSTDLHAAEKVVTALVAQIEKVEGEANVTNKALVDAALANKIAYDWKGITHHAIELSIIAAMAKRIANPVTLPPTYQDLLDATNRLKEAKGVPFVRNFVQKVSGSKKVADVPHDKWEAVIEAINAAMLLTDLQVDV